ncbi:MAG TPA: mechanosensitive ion channel domain-containing protein, partial [Steroidobacteraceae bacterium]|nr:mechanosensitive ion channel domain-containing protein [Steroidobacteraceae bacterium]
MKDFIDGLLSAANLTQILIILLAAVAGVAAAHFIRAALARSPMTGTHGLLARVLRGLGATSTALVALVVLLVARGLHGLGGGEPAILDYGIQLAAVLLGVRLGVYLLALALGPRSWVARWESRLALLVWMLFGFALLGWFDFIESSLESIDLIPGKKQFTLWSLVKGLVVVTLFIVMASLVSRAVEARVMKITGLALSTRVGISKFTYFFLSSLGVLVGINAAGVDLTALTVLTGAVGIGLGFGLQAIASNFVSGFVLLMDKSIKPGDVISFTGMTGTSTENFGWVQELRGRYVVVRDRDGVETLVPNQQLITNPVINWSYSDPRVRLKLPVRISYQDDPEVAMAVLVEAAHCNPRVLREPAPVSRLMAFGDSGIELELRFWIADPQEG